MPTDLQTELEAILHRAAIASLSACSNQETARAFLRVTGADATRWLNGMVTNSVQALAPGEGCYNFLLNAQGRILGDCTVYREIDPADPPSFLLQTANSQLETVQHHLDHFIIMDDVELTPAYTGASSIVVLGPTAPAKLNAVGLPAPAPLHSVQADSPHGPVLLAATRAAAFELHANPAAISSLAADLRSAGAIDVSSEALEALRILQARPLYGRDITEKYLPQETNQPQALHFNKGCYLGQEIVERIRSRGQVHRVLTPLALTGNLPSELPTPIEADGKSVGEITSAAFVPLPEGDQILALGYVRRESLDTRKTLTYTGGTAAARSLTEPSASNPTESTHA
jgi:folate-binding protein YgfZ